MNRPALHVVLLLILAEFSVSAQEPPCASKIRTTVVGGSYHASALAVRDNLLVSADYDSLTTWDVSDPDSPVRLGQWISVAEGRSYGVRNHLALDAKGFAYVGNWDPFAVEIFDVRDPYEPKPVSRISGRLSDFVLAGDLLIGVTGRLYIYDVSDPFRPIPVCDGCLEFESNGPPTYWGFTALSMAGDLAVVSHFDGFWVIDTSDPSAPLEVSSIILDRFHSSNIQVWAGEDRAIVWSSAAQHIVDLSDATAPVAHRFDFYLYRLEWAEFSDHTVFFGDFGQSHVARLDLTDPAQPVEIEPFAGFSDAGRIVDDLLYLSTSYGLETWDIGVTTPRQTGIEDWNQVSQIVVDGDRGTVRTRWGVRSFDLGTSGVPMEGDRLDIGSQVGSIAFEDSTIAAALYPPVVAVISVEEDLQLVERSRISFGDCYAYRPDLDANLLAVPLSCPDGPSAVELYDLADPSDPRLLGRIETDESNYGAVIRDDRLFVTSGGSVLDVDISDPGEPSILNGLWIAEDVEYLYAIVDAGQCLFVSQPSGAYQGLLAAIDVTYPGDPVVIATADSGPLSLAADFDGVVAGRAGSQLVLSKCPAIGEAIEQRVFEMPLTGTSVGSIRDGRLFVASRHSIDELDLACVQPEADFRWYSIGTRVYFEDRTTYNNWWGDPERVWKWTFPTRTVTSDDWRSAVFDFGLPGVYKATLQVITDMGSSSVTKTIEIPRQPGLSPDTRQSGGRVAP